MNVGLWLLDRVPSDGVALDSKRRVRDAVAIFDAPFRAMFSAPLGGNACEMLVA